MNQDELRRAVVTVLGEIAPEVDFATLPGDADLREEVGLDSMDVLNFVSGIHERTGVEIPELDYEQLGSVDACVAYLSRRVPRETQ